MQAAAMNPIALNEDGVDASIIEKEIEIAKDQLRAEGKPCLLYTSPSPRDQRGSRMPSSA